MSTTISGTVLPTSKPSNVWYVLTNWYYIVVDSEARRFLLHLLLLTYIYFVCIVGFPYSVRHDR